MTITDKESEFLFQNNKVFYKGVIEDNNDPLKMARYRVRILGIHSNNKVNVPTSTLPWAVSMNPLIFGFDQGVGVSSIARVGTWVWVIFDNNDVNSPVITGAIVGGNDINSKVKADYLNIHVLQTPGGHYLDFEDNGKIQIYHKSGKQITIDINGNFITDTKDCTINVGGNLTANVTGNANITASGTGTFKSTGAMSIEGSTTTIKGSPVTIQGNSTMVI